MNKNMNVCVIAGTHGDEYGLGHLVHEALSRDVPNQTYQLVGNPRAVELGKRFVDYDLNKSFGSAATSSGYEAERAQEIVELTQREGFTHIIDVHTAPTTSTIVPIVPPTCVGSKADDIINKLPPVTSVVYSSRGEQPKSLVGSFGQGGIGLECPRYSEKEVAETIASGVTHLLSGLTLPKLVRAIYLVDGKIPLDIELPNGSLADFEEIPQIGGYAFVATDMYKYAGHQGMRASSRMFREI